MNNNVKVSVIIPIYNGERYLDRCLKSIIGQTVKEIEILCMIGLSEDLSLEKCIEWQKRDDRIIIVSRKEHSLGNARNCALNLARGDYIVYVDCDDYIEDVYIEKMLKPLQENKEIELTCCGFDKVLRDKSVIFESLPELEGEFECNYDTFRRYVKWGMVWIKMYRKDWLREHGIVQFEGYHEDDAHMLMISATAKKIYFVRETLYHYFVDNSNSITKNLKSRIDWPDSLGYGIKYLMKHNLYEKNKASIRIHLLQGLKGILEETNYENEVVEKAKLFLNTFYPEVLEEVSIKKDYISELKEKVILFGAGADGKRFLKENPEIPLMYIVDNNKQLQNTYIEELQIFSFEKLVAEREDVSVIIASTKYYYDIARQLRAHGILNYMRINEYIVKKMLKVKRQMFVLMNTPEHSNIGDHVIAVQEEKFVNKYLSAYDFVEITESQCRNWRDLLKKYMPKDAVIAITGGGFLGSLWYMNGEKTVQEILSDYFEHKIIIFPQTMFYEESDRGQKLFKQAKKIYARCKDLTIFLREEKSYHIALSLVGKTANCQLIPDIALSLEGYDKETMKKEEIAALCLRTDLESILSENQKEEVKRYVLKHYKVVEQISMFDSNRVTKENREERINSKIYELKKYSLVITDALHCMILCAVSGTPCIAINNISKKLEGVYQWIKHITYIQFISDVNELEESIKIITSCKKNKFEIDYESYFQQMKKSILD